MDGWMVGVGLHSRCVVGRLGRIVLQKLGL